MKIKKTVKIAVAFTAALNLNGCGVYGPPPASQNTQNTAGYNSQTDESKAENSDNTKIYGDDEQKYSDLISQKNDTEDIYTKDNANDDR